VRACTTTHVGLPFWNRRFPTPHTTTDEAAEPALQAGGGGTVHHRQLHRHGEGPGGPAAIQGTYMDVCVNISVGDWIFSSLRPTARPTAGRVGGASRAGGEGTAAPAGLPGRYLHICFIQILYINTRLTPFLCIHKLTALQAATGSAGGRPPYAPGQRARRHPQR